MQKQGPSPEGAGVDGAPGGGAMPSGIGAAPGIAPGIVAAAPGPAHLSAVSRLASGHVLC